jgi:hypothetical protein
MSPGLTGKFIPTRRTPGVSTSELLERIVRKYRGRDFDAKLEKLGHADLKAAGSDYDDGSDSDPGYVPAPYHTTPSSDVNHQQPREVTPTSQGHTKGRKGSCEKHCIIGIYMCDFRHIYVQFTTFY